MKLEVKSALIEEKGISSMGYDTELCKGMILGTLTAADDHTSTIQTVHHTICLRDQLMAQSRKQWHRNRNLAVRTSDVDFSFEQAGDWPVGQVKYQTHPTGCAVVNVLDVGVTMGSGICTQ